ncbi:hypothetical protein H311_03804, partial [Anncaliia algerae PRA109]
KNIEDIYIDKNKNQYFPGFLSDFEYDYIYLTSYFLSSDLFSECSTLFLFEKFLLANAETSNKLLKFICYGVYDKLKLLLKYRYQIVDLSNVVREFVDLVKNEKLFLLESL